MKTTSQQIAKLDQAIKAWHRCTGAMPLVLTRYLNVLYRVREWETKAALAKTKLAKYRKQARYYQKKVGK